jgi:hypothetical protein
MSPPPSKYLPAVRIHADDGRVSLSVGAAHRDLSPSGARYVARHLDAAADATEHAAALDVTAAARGHRSPHAFPLPAGLVALRFGTASAELTEAQAFKLADALADAAEAVRDVLAPEAAQ